MLRGSSSFLRQSSQDSIPKLRCVNDTSIRSFTNHQRCCTVASRHFSSQWPRPRRRSNSRILPRLLPRNLGTAVDNVKLVEDIPFENLPSKYMQTRTGTLSTTPSLYEMQPFDFTSPLTMPEPVPGPPRQRNNLQGVPGDVEEMLPVFDACLRVGKLERAGLILKRLSSEVFRNSTLSAEDVMTLHTKYLETWLMHIKSRPNPDDAEGMHRWFELHIRNPGLPFTPETIAFLLKASLLTTASLDQRLQRLVKRYMGMMPGDAAFEVLYCTDILDDVDRAVITELDPTYSTAFEEEELMDALAQADFAEASKDTPAVAHVIPPEVLATPQKGSGMMMLKQTLSLFEQIPLGADIGQLTSAEKREIQAKIERDCVDAAIQRWRHDNEVLIRAGVNTSLKMSNLNAKLYDWQLALEEKLAGEVAKIEASEAAEEKGADDMERCMYGPFFRQSTTSRLAAVTILCTLSNLSVSGAAKGAPIVQVMNSIGRLVEEDIKAQQKHKASKAASKWARIAAKRALRRKNNQAGGPVDDEEAVAIAEASSAAETGSVSEKPWPATIKAKVGAALLSALIDTAHITVYREDTEIRGRISQSQPAFTHSNMFRRGKKLGILIANPSLVDILTREPRGDFLARHLPMVVEPDPWTQFDKGGFIESPVGIVRTKPGEKDQMMYTKAAMEMGSMEQVQKGLDVLGRTSWKINRPVFDVMLAAWNEGKEIANFPPLNPDIQVPAEPESTGDPNQRKMWMRAVKLAENQRSGLHSVRCYINLQLEIARAYRDQTFYFPHNVDFRGRAYPIPTYLNHMGADHVRGILRFAEGRELGVRGLQWLKVQLANVFGYDKASLKDREQFAVDHLADIRDSANDPLGGKRWWLQAEDPWQCLAACFELQAATELDDPTKYISTLPVHQDGTCNGLQHYAALGGDSWGARQVNLEPGEKPADVYSAVANLVIQSIEADAEQGVSTAIALKDKIKRKVVKQTVMTNVYGVTFDGAKKQVLKQLDAIYPKLHEESGIDPMLHASYIATKIFKALSTMFRGAHDIQHWLGECGSRVCRALTAEQLKAATKEEPPAEQAADSKTVALADKNSKKQNAAAEYLAQFRSTIIWTTPLRMPVVQPYRVSTGRTVSTCLQEFNLVQPDRLDPVHRRKQLQAFPPNFVHSLDASHMMLSALECDELGLNFAAVHDSFWTHAADVDTMNRVLRDAFIRIHSEDVIARLASEFEARYRGGIYLAQVYSDTAAGKKIAAWRKKAGKKYSVKDELIAEKTRMELLKSDDPAKVEEGRKMVTPGSIFEQTEEQEKSLAEEEEMAEGALGHIPEGEGDDHASVTSASDSANNANNATDDTTQQAEAIDAGVEPETLPDPEEAAMEAASHGEDPLEVEPPTEDDIDHEAKLQSIMGSDPFADKLNGVSKPKKRAKKQRTTLQIWLPLTFPEVPKKGDFDVRRLRGSEYFFS